MNTFLNYLKEQQALNEKQHEQQQALFAKYIGELEGSTTKTEAPKASKTSKKTPKPQLQGSPLKAHKILESGKVHPASKRAQILKQVRDGELDGRTPLAKAAINDKDIDAVEAQIAEKSAPKEKKTKGPKAKASKTTSTDEKPLQGSRLKAFKLIEAGGIHHKSKRFRYLKQVIAGELDGRSPIAKAAINGGDIDAAEAQVAEKQAPKATKAPKAAKPAQQLQGSRLKAFEILEAGVDDEDRAEKLQRIVDGKLDGRSKEAKAAIAGTTIDTTNGKTNGKASAAKGGKKKVQAKSTNGKANPKPLQGSPLKAFKLIEAGGIHHKSKRYRILQQVIAGELDGRSPLAKAAIRGDDLNDLMEQADPKAEAAPEGPLPASKSSETKEDQEPATLLDKLATVLGSKEMRVDAIEEALKEKGWYPTTPDPRETIVVSLSGEKDLFERVTNGTYRRKPKDNAPTPKLSPEQEQRAAELVADQDIPADPLAKSPDNLDKHRPDPFAVA